MKKFKPITVFAELLWDINMILFNIDIAQMMSSYEITIDEARTIIKELTRAVKSHEDQTEFYLKSLEKEKTND